MTKVVLIEILAAFAFVVSANFSAHAQESVATTRQIGESVLLAGSEPGRLAFPVLTKMAVEVRSTYLPGLPTTIRYRPGLDYRIGSDGRLRRTPKSRIPDYRQSAVFGVKSFDHTEYPEYGNKSYFAYVDYSYAGHWEASAEQSGSDLAVLSRVKEKLASGKKIKLVAFGDSVTQGGETTSPNLIYWVRWSQLLQKKYPAADIQTVNSGQGGDLSDDGLARLDSAVIAHQPDLVLIAFGLNDFNRGPVDIDMGKWEERTEKWARSWAKWRGLPPPPQKNRIQRSEHFAVNLRLMVDRVKKQTGADVILVSPFQPNPNWKFSRGDMTGLVAATKRVALETKSAYANVFDNWQDFSTQKQPEDLLANNANHPNDFGHWIYFQSLAALKL